MRLHDPLDDLLRGKTSVRVLRTICLFPEKEFTGRELARMAGSPASKVVAVLERFRLAGLVDRRTVGRSNLWTANRGHIIITELAGIFVLERALPTRLSEEIRAATADPRISRVALFGSLARAEETMGSDVDIMVMVRHQRDLDPARLIIDSLEMRIRTLFGLRLAPIFHTEAELPRLRRLPLFKNILKEGKMIRGVPFG